MRIFQTFALGAWVGIAGSAQGLNFAQPHVPGEIIVRFESEVSKAEAARFLSVEGGVIKRPLSLPGTFLVTFPEDQNHLADSGARLSSHREIKWLELNHVFSLDSMPNDPKFSEQWGFHKERKNSESPDTDIDAPEAWNITTGSHDVLVAIMDTGIDHNHEDLKENIWQNPGEMGVDEEGKDKSSNGIDDDGNGYIDDFRGWDFVNNDNDPLDDHSHGTHVAGTVGAVGNNEMGVAGINWKVSLVAVKIFGAMGTATTDNIVDGLNYATNLGVHVSNNSWGSAVFSKAISEAFTTADEKEIMLVAAAGNSGSNNDQSPHYPSSFDLEHVVAVAATDSKDQMAGFSCYGVKSVDVAAPGVDILSTVRNNGYGKKKGTSMAAPHVAGLLALVKSAYPDLNHKQIIRRVINSTDPVAGLSQQLYSGGRINAFNALEDDRNEPSPVTSAKITERGLGFVALQWSHSGDDDVSGQAKSYIVKMASNSIDTESDWNAAKDVNYKIMTTDSVGLKVRVNDLEFGAQGYLSIRAVDNVGNLSSLGPALGFKTPQSLSIYSHNADNLEGVSVEGTWGIEQVEGESMFSDSPEGSYENGQDVSLTFSSMKISNAQAFLQFNSEYNLEKKFDKGFVEVSVDGGDSWSVLETFTGSQNNRTYRYEITEYLKQSENVQWRFRLKTDSSVTREGWLIDTIQVIVPDVTRAI